MKIEVQVQPDLQIKVDPQGPSILKYTESDSGCQRRISSARSTGENSFSLFLAGRGPLLAGRGPPFNEIVRRDEPDKISSFDVWCVLCTRFSIEVPRRKLEYSVKYYWADILPRRTGIRGRYRRETRGQNPGALHWNRFGIPVRWKRAFRSPLHLCSLRLRP
jgi:hypothetical protein